MALDRVASSVTLAVAVVGLVLPNGAQSAPAAWLTRLDCDIENCPQWLNFRGFGGIRGTQGCFPDPFLV